MYELTKIDLLRERFDISYKLARDVLEKTEGDLIKGLILLEQKQKQKFWSSVKDFYRFSNETKIKISKEDKILLSVPFSAGAIALLGALIYDELAVAAGIGVAAAILKGFKVEIVGKQGKKEAVAIN